jgi:ABC-type nitrate/sulfonate/bicarbonate transport system substrate-binding protein
MVEPYATMLEMMGTGTVIKRTADVWKGAPGCSLATTVSLKEAQTQLTQKMVMAFARGAMFVKTNPDESADIASNYIGINPRFIREALNVNSPDVNAIRNSGAMEGVLSLMIELGYINKMPANYADLSFLDKAESVLNC